MLFNNTKRAFVVLVLTIWLGVLGATRLSAATVPPGFSETVVAGPWNDAVGTAFESNGRIYVWERTGQVWFQDPGDPSFTLLLNISEEVGAWEDHGMLGFAFDPDFRVNGYIYLLYVVDRHHLLNFGTGSYNSISNNYNSATIGRVTRYTCTLSNGFKSVDLSSRLVLIGETITNGFPILSYTHGVGSLAFAEDGTLLVSCGDGASADTADEGGTVNGSYAPQGLSDSIIRTNENVGAWRAQLVDSLSGKILRIDPATGNGVPSNPYYDASKPRSAKSRVWMLGVRNPCRFGIKPESGSHHEADGNPGVLYIGDVGWNTLESLRVVTGPGKNCGWPLFEGLSLTGNGYNGNVTNLDAPNPYYTPSNGCGQYFTFADLLKADSTNAASQPPFDNPCNSSLKIPGSIPQFLHTRPVLDWNHASATTRTPTYGSLGQAQTADVGAGGSPVSGAQFQGSCAIGGTWYTASNFPAAYQDRYYFADWNQGVIKTLTCDANDRPVALSNFASSAGSVVSIVQHPIDGSLYYVSYYFSGSTIRRLAYAGNRNPIAVASVNTNYGPTPLTVQLSSAGSSDPDGQPITYSWNFGDGSPANTNANPSHNFSAPPGVPTKYVVTLTVTDSGALSAQATVIVSLNNTPPNVTITSPVDGSPVSSSNATPVNLIATVSDNESSDSQLQYQWQVLFHHNDHNHGSPPDTNHTTSAVLEATGCDGINIYYYRILLTVTDPAGLSTSREVRVYPDCGPNTPPTISAIANQSIPKNGSTAPIPFTVNDLEVAPANLQLSAVSSNLALVPNGNIIIGGGGSNRTVTVTPAAGQTGTAMITINVFDGPNNVSTNFTVTVYQVNNAPTISNVPDQATSINTPIGPIGFTVADAESPAASLTVSGASSNTTLLPTNNIAFGGSGSNRTVILTPAPGQAGVTTVTLTVSDGTNSANDTFQLLVSTQAAGLVAAYSFDENTNTMVADDSGNGNNGTIGSATWTTSGKNGNALTFNGTTARVTVPDSATLDLTSAMTLSAWVYPTATDGWRDVIYKGPDDIYYLMGSSDTGAPALGGTFGPTTLRGTGSLPLNTWTYLAGTYDGATLRLYTNGVQVASLAQTGAISGSAGNLTIGGDALYGQYFAGRIDDVRIYNVALTAAQIQSDMNTPVGATLNTAPTISVISNQSTTVNTPTAALPFTILDSETASSNLVLSASSSNTNLAPTNKIVFGGSGASRTVTVTPASNQLGSTTITLAVSDGSLSASNSFVLTVNPAPLTVTASNLSRCYGQTNPPLTGSIVGLQAGDNITPNFYTSANTNSPLGGYPITFTLSDPGSKLGNYAVTTNNGTLTVTNALLAVTANNANKGYGATLGFAGTEFAVTGGTLFNGNTLTNAILASLGTNATATVGSYAITVTNAVGAGSTNYKINYTNGMLTVTGAVLTVTSASTNKVYGTSFQPMLYSVSGLVNSNTVTNVTLTSTGSLLNAPAGNHPIVVTNATGLGLTNYNVTYSNGTLSVTRAALTATADNQSRAYGQPNPVFSISYDGFVNGENTNVLDVLPTAGTTATNNSAPGPYTISLGGGSDDNYSFTLVSGTLTVTQPGPVVISSVVFLDPAQLQIIGLGDANVTYIVQSSTNLVQWNYLGTTPADGGGAFHYEDTTVSGAAMRFYRMTLP